MGQGTVQRRRAEHRRGAGGVQSSAVCAHRRTARPTEDHAQGHDSETGHMGQCQTEGCEWFVPLCAAGVCFVFDILPSFVLVPSRVGNFAGKKCFLPLAGFSRFKPAKSGRKWQK